MSTSHAVRYAVVAAAIGALFTVAVLAQDPVTADQRANLRERIALVTEILDHRQAEAESLGLSSGWRQAQMQQLLPLPLGALKKLANAGSLDELSQAAARLTPESLVVAPVTEDLVYKPISPCRYIDTRNAGGKIDGSRGYDVLMAGSTYGGDGFCNPTALFGVGEDSFGGLAMNITIIAPSAAPGFAAVKPIMAPGVPTSSLVNWYEAGASVQVANQGILTLDHSSMEPAEFFIVTSSPVHVIVDIFGAFIAPRAAALEKVYAESQNTISPGHTLITGSAICPAGYALTGGGATVAPGITTVVVKHSFPSDSGDSWQCSWRNDGPSDVVVKCRAICARVAGR